MTLYFAMPYDTFTTPMETRDVSTIPTGIKKLLMVAILFINYKKDATGVE